MVPGRPGPLPEGSETTAVVTFRETNRQVVAESRRGSEQRRWARHAMLRRETRGKRGESINYGLFVTPRTSGNGG